MNKKEVTELLGKFGELSYNGFYFPSIMHGVLLEIEGDEVVIKRPDRSKIKVVIKSIKYFKEKRIPK